MKSFCLPALLVGVALLAYSPALQGDRLIDDDQHITRPELQSLAGLGRIWTEIGATQQYYPVLHTAFWIEHRLWGDAVAGYHLVNVLLHCVSAFLIVGVMRRLRLPGGWPAAFVFALHPLAVESVAWMAEQKNTLSTVFYLGAGLVFLTHVERPRPALYGCASVLFACALLSKTATATLPVALLVVLWWRDRARPGLRGEDAACGTGAACPHGGSRAVARVALLLPWFAASAIAGAITVSVERTLIAGIDANLSLGWLERLLVAGRAFWFYVGKLIWPANLNFLYARWDIDVVDPLQWVYPAAFGIVAALCLCRALRAGIRGPLAALLFFGATLAPVLGFVNVEWFVFSYVADHFAYVASLGLIVPAVALAAGWVRDLPVRLKRVAHLAGLSIVGVLGVLTWRHSGIFRDSLTLCAHAVAHSPQSIAANYLLGVELAARPGRAADAVEAFRTALRLNPDAAPVHEQLGRALLASPGRRGDAIDHFETALRLAPDSTTVRRALADAWFDEGKSRAESISPANAAAAYRRAVELRPDFAEAHFNLGNLLLRAPERRAEAIAHFEAAVAAKPDFAEAHTNLGVALAAEPGRRAQAIEHFEAALRANPDFAPARNNLARLRQMRE